MTVNYPFGTVGAHGAVIRARGASVEPGYRAVVSDVDATAGLWGGALLVARREFSAGVASRRGGHRRAGPYGTNGSAGGQHGEYRARPQLELGIHGDR